MFSLYFLDFLQWKIIAVVTEKCYLSRNDIDRSIITLSVFHELPEQLAVISSKVISSELLLKLSEGVRVNTPRELYW